MRISIENEPQGPGNGQGGVISTSTGRGINLVGEVLDPATPIIVVASGTSSRRPEIREKTVADLKPGERILGLAVPRAERWTLERIQKLSGTKPTPPLEAQTQEIFDTRARIDEISRQGPKATLESLDALEALLAANAEALKSSRRCLMLTRARLRSSMRDLQETIEAATEAIKDLDAKQEARHVG